MKDISARYTFPKIGITEFELVAAVGSLLSLEDGAEAKQRFSHPRVLVRVIPARHLQRRHQLDLLAYNMLETSTEGCRQSRCW